MPRRLLILSFLILSMGAATACSEQAKTGEADMHAGEAPAQDGKIDLPRAVRENLGIDWSTAEMRVVSDSHFLPAIVEAPPEAHEAHHALFRGRLTLHVGRYQAVQAGDLLATLQPLDRAAMLAALEGVAAEVLAAERDIAAKESEHKVKQGALRAAEKELEAGKAQLAARKEHQSNL
ncbi:MAG: hypothetical protein KDB07_11485, partial [Planctomycetes bacterium]|nr:hypothetical protein [Planctomycetota bacterium]